MYVGTVVTGMASGRSAKSAGAICLATWAHRLSTGSNGCDLDPINLTMGLRGAGAEVRRAGEMTLRVSRFNVAATTQPP